MSVLQIEKVKELPITLTANTMYLVEGNSSEPLVLAVTDDTGTIVHRTVDSGDIRDYIARYGGGSGGDGGLSRKLLNQIRFGIKLI